MIPHTQKFTPDDCQALLKILAPFESETWGRYIDRAMTLGLMTLGEACYLGETYGHHALQQKPMKPILDNR